LFSPSLADAMDTAFHKKQKRKKKKESVHAVRITFNNLAEPFSKYREEELERMWTNFYGPDQSYHFREGAPRS
jgi:hypothetical protein